MRVLVGSIDLDLNRFFSDLNRELGQCVQLRRSADEFWRMAGEYDVVHLHFPEYLTLELEAAYYESRLTSAQIDATELRMRHWANRAKVVITRHVVLPHDARRDAMWERMYAMFYRYAHGIAHFAQASIDEFRERYRSLAFAHGREPLHVLIPQHNYVSLPNSVTRDAARSRLGISSTAAVMLVFGAIRSDEERQLVLSTFRGLRIKQKLLLVSRWRERLAKVSWVRLKYWLRNLTRFYHRLHPRYHFNYEFVAEEDAQLYLNAADVLFIPRFRVLNSGNIAMGMTFGRVVVGPDSWDVGELLRSGGNPVFDPERTDTAVTAVEEGFRLAEEGKIGPANRRRALRDWAPERCARQYVDLFNSVCVRCKGL